MTDIHIGDLNLPSTPPCPLCGGETVLTQMHKAVAKATDVFRCTQCGVEYPVPRKAQDM